MTESTKSRNEGFATKPQTRIWQEIADENNPYIASESRCHGYDHLQIIEHANFASTLFLLFRGQFPGPQVELLMERVLMAFINPGPRHAAVRAAQLAGAGKTDPVHILPIGLSVLGGEAATVADAMKFLIKSSSLEPETVLSALPQNMSEEDFATRLPGFGRHFGGVDTWSAQLAQSISSGLSNVRYLSWGARLHALLQQNQAGWLRVGVFAAAMLDLGLPARVGVMLYQLLNAPGIAAQGLEMHGLPRTAMPFLDDAHYFIGVEAAARNRHET